MCLVTKLCGRKPGKNWIDWFKKLWPNLCYSRPGGLNPKWAQNFNASNVAGFYKLLKAIYDVYPDLPPPTYMEYGQEGDSTWWRLQAVKKILLSQGFKSIEVLSDLLGQPGTCYCHRVYFTFWFVNPSRVHPGSRAHPRSFQSGCSNQCSWHITQWVD